jgi:hypothetical protein
MRFMLLLKYDENAQKDTPPDPAIFEEMGRFNTAMVDAGVLLAGEGLAPSSQGAAVTFDGEEPTVSDGPFTEAKELVGGFAILQAGSKAEAIELGRRFMQVHADFLGPEAQLTLEIRAMVDPMAPEGCAAVSADSATATAPASTR